MGTCCGLLSCTAERVLVLARSALERIGRGWGLYIIRASFSLYEYQQGFGPRLPMIGILNGFVGREAIRGHELSACRDG